MVHFDISFICRFNPNTMNSVFESFRHNLFANIQLLVGSMMLLSALSPDSMFMGDMGSTGDQMILSSA